MMIADRSLSLVLCAAALGVPAFADELDFQGVEGQIAGTSATTDAGTSIEIQDLLPFGTALHSAVANPITGGALTFSATGGSVAGDVYTYTSGTYSISGDDTAAGVSGTLVSGNISSLTVDLGNAVLMFSGVDTINANLASYFGEPTGGWSVTEGSTDLFEISGGLGGVYFANTSNTDVPDTLSSSAVPEPGYFGLLASAMAGVFVFARRRK